MAKANGLALGAKELAALQETLETLEKNFQSLVKELPPELEPALGFRAEAESE